MGTAATQAKKRWNAEHYRQVKVSIAPSLAASFKSACGEANVSMAEEIAQFMTEYIKAEKKSKPLPDYKTKRQRRTAMKAILPQLEQIRAAEEQSRDNIPENLRGSSVFDVADQCVCLLDEAIEILGSIY
jgi:hypothetical protein